MVFARALAREHASKGRLQETGRHWFENPPRGKPFDRSGLRGDCRRRLSVAEVLERTRPRDETFLGRQAIEKVETRKIALVQLVVKAVAQVILDDGLGQRGPRRLLPRQLRELLPSRLIRAPQHLRESGGRNSSRNGPEGEDKGMPGQGPPFGREVEHNLSVQARLQGRVADDESSIRLDGRR